MREVVLICTARGRHDPAVVFAYTFPDDIAPGEFVRWRPVFDGSTLTLSCPACPRRWEFKGGKVGSRLLGELERQTRTVGRVECDLSKTRELDSAI